jgi:hypothetical protein
VLAAEWNDGLGDEPVEEAEGVVESEDDWEKEDGGGKRSSTSMEGEMSISGDARIDLDFELRWRRSGVIGGRRLYRGDAGGDEMEGVALEVRHSDWLAEVSDEVCDASEVSDDAIRDGESQKLESDVDGREELLALEDAVLDLLLPPELLLFRLRMADNSAARSRFWSKKPVRIFGGLGECTIVLYVWAGGSPRTRLLYTGRERVG